MCLNGFETNKHTKENKKNVKPIKLLNQSLRKQQKETVSAFFNCKCTYSIVVVFRKFKITSQQKTNEIINE